MTIETPKPQHGIWTLIAPDGRQYTANSPLGCASLEINERVTEEVMLERILDDVTCKTCGELLRGHEDETDTQCRWCVTEWQPITDENCAAMTPNEVKQEREK